MHPRYPAPDAEKLWSDAARVRRWQEVTDMYARDAIDQALLGPIDSEAQRKLKSELADAAPPSPSFLEWQERLHGHEVVAFLAAYTEFMSDQLAPHIHYGLTSSDLTEYDLFQAAHLHARLLALAVKDLMLALSRRVAEFDGLSRAGRTHGRLAEATTLSHQLSVHFDAFRRIAQALSHLGSRWPVKTPGPTGNQNLRKLNHPGRVPSTQVIHRDYLLEWAALYLRAANALDNLATFVRLGSRSEVDEFTEGAARSRTGSSAMPGKLNPIASEKVCGLARIARGHFLALAEVSNLWEDRDLTNSSTERIAVPDLAATVEHMTRTMTQVITELEVDTAVMAVHATHGRCHANARQSQIQKTNKVGPIEASRRAREER